MEVEEQYPSWLHKKLIEDELPWGQKSSLDIVEFLEKYTLHDSFWVGVFHHIGFDQSATLGFQWDAVWLPDEMKKSTSLVDDWPYLFFQINGLREMSSANYVDIGGTCRAIAGSEVLNIDGASHLAIDDVYGGQVNFMYTDELSILALNPDGTVLKIM